MSPGRRISAAVRLLPIAGVCAALAFASADARARVPRAATTPVSRCCPRRSPRGRARRCASSSPSEKPLDGELSLIAPDGSVAAQARARHGGPPYSWFAEVASPAAGKWRVTLASSRCGTITREIAVRADRPAPPSSVEGSVWPLRNSWNRANENLFAAWIEKLFDDPLDAELSWPALHVGLRDQSRNMLFNHLGLGEDSMKTVLRPDCADLPYFLRAYFAFKMGLPFGYAKCTRGGGGRAPTCPQWFNIQNLEPPPAPADPLAAAAGAPPAQPRATRAGFRKHFRPLLIQCTGPAAGDAKCVGRSAAAAARARGVLCPICVGDRRRRAFRIGAHGARRQQHRLLSRVAEPGHARPGTVYADPYGHILMIVRRVPQTAQSAGVILAVDGQPDGTVARKRFWRGNFLFAQDPALGGPGFKRFRPVVRDQSGALRRLSNAEIAKYPQYADFSLDQGKLSIEDFYDRMDDVMSPQPLEPMSAMKEAITSLEEQVKTRVTSVENGRKFQNSGKGDANMPDGPAIFETIGAWEDFSTPSRDLRLLIAIDVVRGFPDRVARRPERYAMPMGKTAADVKVELQRVLASELANRKFAYPRSDGSQWTLALRDVLDRATDLEMAYNPNDCVELRWGARAGSDEATTCKRSASQAQRAKMTKYRAWFSERRRPPRA